MRPPRWRASAARPLSPRRIPIRWRLTLWYVTLLTLTLEIFGAGIYTGMRYRLYASVTAA